MTQAKDSRVMQSLAEEVADSLKIGDHLRHDRQLLRSMLGLVTLVMILLRRPKIIQRLTTDVTLVISNPVAHGSRFAGAVLEALTNMRVDALGDRRLAQGPILREMSHFPSLTARSLNGSVNWGMLAYAIRIRKRAALVQRDYPTLTRLYLETLFLLQAIRYCLAENRVRELPANHLWIFDFDRHAYCRPLVWWANTAGRATVTLVHGSPNMNYLPPLAGSILVWGATQMSWFREASPTTRTHPVGRPEFGLSFPPCPPRTLRIMHSLEKLTNGERGALLQVCEAARQLGMEVSLRLHPSAVESQLDPVWKGILQQCTLEDNSLGLLESFDGGDVILGITSTAVVDALACGLPAWTLADDDRELPCDLEALRQAKASLHAEVFGTGSDTPGGQRGLETLAAIRSTVIRATNGESALLIQDSLAKILRQMYLEAK